MPTQFILWILALVVSLGCNAIVPPSVVDADVERVDAPQEETISAVRGDVVKIAARQGGGVFKAIFSGDTSVALAEQAFTWLGWNGVEDQKAAKSPDATARGRAPPWLVGV